MEYGILVAIMYGAVEETDLFQLVGTVASVDEARELAANYLQHGPTNNAIPADEFEIHRRGQDGFYSIRETLN